MECLLGYHGHLTRLRLEGQVVDAGLEVNHEGITLGNLVQHTRKQRHAVTLRGSRELAAVTLSRRGECAYPRASPEADAAI